MYGIAEHSPRARAGTLQFRDFEPTDRTAVIALLAEGRPAHYQRAKEAVFDWQFAMNPHDDGRSPFLVGTVNGEIVALNGFMPVDVRYQDRPLHASWSCDTFVASGWRGRGIGKALLARASERAPVMLGYGISDMSDPILERQGWALHPATRSLFFHVREPGIKGAVKDLCTLASKRYNDLRRPLPRLDVTRHDEDFGDEVDELWDRCAPGYRSAVQRDAAYLNWKYRRHPFERYDWYAVREGGRLRGAMVARWSQTASVIVDYSGPAEDVELMSGLVSATTADLAVRGTVRVLCETTHAPLQAALERSGFIGSRYRSRFRVRTNRPDDIHPLEGWFLTAGDSDGDLMNEPDAAPTARLVH